MTKIKICGLTRPDDAARTATVGADYLGLNFWPPSKRYLSPDLAPAVAAAARAAGTAQLVGLFVNQPLAEIVAIADAIKLDVVQLHGDETPADVAAVHRATGLPVWRAVAVGSLADVEQLYVWATADGSAAAAIANGSAAGDASAAAVAAILLDAPTAGRGGAGKTFDWDLAREAQRRHPTCSFVLAGGLGPSNVAAAIAAVAPWAVDVASGVESAPGIKDPAKVAAFIAAARAPHT